MAEILIRAISTQPRGQADGTVRIVDTVLHILRVSTWDHTGEADWRIVGRWDQW